MSEQKYTLEQRVEELENWTVAIMEIITNQGSDQIKMLEIMAKSVEEIPKFTKEIVDASGELGEK